MNHCAHATKNATADKERGRQGDKETFRRRSRPHFLLVSPSPCLLVFIQGWERAARTMRLILRVMPAGPPASFRGLPGRPKADGRRASACPSLGGAPRN